MKMKNKKFTKRETYAVTVLNQTKIQFEPFQRSGAKKKQKRNKRNFTALWAQTECELFANCVLFIVFSSKYTIWNFTI